MIAETTKLKREIKELKELLLSFADEYRRKIRDENMGVDRKPRFNLSDLKHAHDILSKYGTSINENPHYPKP